MNEPKKGYIMHTPKQNIFFETSKRRTDATAGAVLDIIGELYKSNPETLARAKADRGTLDDIKKRLTPCRLYENGERLQFYHGESLIIDYHKTSPEIITRSL